MSMKLGIQKRQWIILFFVLSLPLLLNTIAIQQQIGTNGMRKLLSGNYQPSNPNLSLVSVAEILSDSWFVIFIVIALLSFLCWLIIFVSNQRFFQKQHLIVKLLISLASVILIAKVFEIASAFILPLAWLPQFNDYLLGIPFSEFTWNWSRWFIFPATAIILLVALILSRNKNLESSSNT